MNFKVIIKIQFFIFFILISLLSYTQDTINNRKSTNHISFQSYLGYRYVAQEIPYSFAIGLGVSYQIKKHVFAFRFLSRINNLKRTKEFMPINPILIPDETIWEIGILYRLYSNKNQTFSFLSGAALIKGFNHGSLIYQPQTYNVVYEKEYFKDIGLPLELHYLLLKTKKSGVGKIFLSSVANINAVKSYAGIMLLFQITI